jgi:hypothetical protein
MICVCVCRPSIVQVVAYLWVVLVCGMQGVVLLVHYGSRS